MAQPKPPVQIGPVTLADHVDSPVEAAVIPNGDSPVELNAVASDYGMVIGLPDCIDHEVQFVGGEAEAISLPGSIELPTLNHRRREFGFDLGLRLETLITTPAQHDQDQKFAHIPPTQFSPQNSRGVN